METETLQPIVAYLDIGHLPEDQQNELANTASQNLMQSMIVRCSILLDETEQQALESQIDAGTIDQAGVLGFFAQHIPGFDEIFAEELRSIKTDIDMVLGRYNPEPVATV